MIKTIRRFIGILVLLLSYIVPSNAQQPFYVYRNDGIINAFFTNEVDSIVYSQLDLDSMFHQEYLVQEIYTRDSIYRIPLELIDSIGYITPETVYQPGVKVLEGEIRSYITSRNGLKLTFHPATPNYILPGVGDKLVTTMIDDVITNAFIGEVIEVSAISDGFEIICNPIELTDVFECYYGISQKEGKPATVKSRSVADGYWGTKGFETLSPGMLSFDLLNNHQISVSYEADDDLSYSLDEAQATISLTPTVDYSAYLIVNKDYGTNVSITAIGNYTLEEYLALAGNITVGDEAPLFEKAISIPEALVDIFFEFGIFAEFKATLSTQQTWEQKYRHVFHWEWSSRGHETIKNRNDFRPTAHSHTGKIGLDGEFSLGGYGKIGIAFIATSSLDIAQIDLCAKGGLSLIGTYVPYKRDLEYAKKSTDLYNQIKDREVGVYWFYGLSAEAELFKWSASTDIPNFFNIPFNNKGKILGFRLVPLFENTQLNQDKDGICHAIADVKEDVFATDVGFALLNQSDESDAAYLYILKDYKGSKAKVTATFSDKARSHDYIVFPLVKYLGMELIAEPSAVLRGVTFKDASILNVKSDPRYNSDGEYLLTSYTAQVKYVIQIDGSEEIKSIQPIIYNNSDWSYSGNKVSVPGDGLFSINTALNYDNNAEMGFAIGYEVNFIDGTSVKSTNCLYFSGTHENPIVTIEDNPSSAKALARTSNIRHENISSSQIVQIE